MDEIAQRVYRFEDFTLDVMRRSLRQGDRDVELRPKSFDVLCCLIENAPRLVTKDEIIEQVWSDVTVTDESLTRCVSDVRLALRDSEQRIIKTVPRRGYLFAAPVSRGTVDLHLAPLAAGDIAAAEPKPDSVAPRPWRQETLLAIASVILMLVSAAVIWSWQRSNGTALPDRPSIAVLPFANMSGSDLDYFSDGIAEDLTAGLSRFADLFVISRDSAFKYKGRHVDARQVGRELGVRYLVQGGVRKDGERLRISAELISADTDKQLWAETYDRDLSSVFAVQDELTQRIAGWLVSHLTKAELDRTRRRPPQSLAAYDAYLRANALIRNMEKDRATIAAARALYEQALAADSSYAPAIQGLADTEFLLWTNPCPDQPAGCEFRQQAVLDRALALAQRSVDLDPSRAQAHATLAWMLRWQNRDTEAAAEFARAVEVNPNFVDGRYGLMLSHWGRAPEAIDYMKRIMRLDPLYPPIYRYWLGKGYFFTGQYEQAAPLIRFATERLPDNLPSQVLFAAVSALMGHDDDARMAVKESLRINPELTIASHLKFMKLVKPADAERLADGMRKAGFAE